MRAARQKLYSRIRLSLILLERDRQPVEDLSSLSTSRPRSRIGRCQRGARSAIGYEHAVGHRQQARDEDRSTRHVAPPERPQGNRGAKAGRPCSGRFLGTHPVDIHKFDAGLSPCRTIPSGNLPDDPNGHGKRGP